ncbi:MAG TPA: pilus assembly PilX N-terminal domain-containing protein, partial [Terriglobales bacterium]|nr:pilus assembly PilX N-terminal domain-containing protein [Terriglobales bacterium]
MTKLRRLKYSVINSPLNNNRGISLIVVLMVMAILLSIVGAGLLFSGINTKVAMNYRTGTRAFYAADVGINSIASALTLNPSISSTSQQVPQPTGSAGTLCYRFGKR